MSKPESFTHEPPMVGTPADIAAGGWVSYIEHCAIVARIERERDCSARRLKMVAACESPIERMLGEALMECVDELAWPKDWPIDEDIISRIEVLPQYELEPFRYDFAIKRKADAGPVLFIECDGREFHSSFESIENDGRKDRRATEVGAHMMRFTGRQIYRNPYMCTYAVLLWLTWRLDARCKQQGC